MELELHTTTVWDEAMWRKAWPLYDSAFPRRGRKSEAIIRAMFAKGMARLYIGMYGKEALAMAIAGMTGDGAALIVDYLAVRADMRRSGAGRAFVDLIASRARRESGVRGIVIEVEADETPANLGRIAFWEACGFAQTAYVHSYIWVPEPYRAMAFSFDPDDPLPADGRRLFRWIEAFHRRAYSGRG